MANIKVRKLEQLSGWIEYKVKTTMLDPPVLRVRLRPTTPLDMVGMASAGGAGFQFGAMVVAAARAAVAEWDLSADGVPLEVTEENKVLCLTPELMAEVVEGRSYLGLAIVEDSQNRELFLKN